MSRAYNSTSMAAAAAAQQQLQHVRVVSSTWARDSHDLFDFESQQLHAKAFSVPRSMTCIRNGTNIEMQAESTSEAAPGSELLIRVLERGGAFWVDRASSSTCSKKLWMVVRDVAPSGYKLAANDVIKLGRFKFRVRQLVTAESPSLQPDLGLDDSGSTACHVEEAEVCKPGCESRACRICLIAEGLGDDDPLISPCHCKGSIEYVHLQCLRYWTKSRLSLSDSPLGSYFYRPLTCELCKSAYPTYLVGRSGRPSPLMEVPPTQPPFIVLENMVRDSRQNSRGLHVISLAEKALMLGRGHESDVRIADVSISRCHATIRFQQGEFLLQDNDSKFGTLVALKRPRQVEASRPLSLQIGRTVLSLSLAAGAGEPGAATGGPASGPGPVLLPPVPMLPARLPPTPTEEERQRGFRLALLTRRSPAGMLGGAEAQEEDVDGLTRRVSF